MESLQAATAVSVGSPSHSKQAAQDSKRAVQQWQREAAAGVKRKRIDPRIVAAMHGIGVVEENAHD